MVNVLEKNKIEYLLEENVISFDPTLANSQFSKEYTIKLHKIDFDKVDAMQTEISSELVNSVESDYYLFEFTNEELIDLVSKKDEWSKLDYLLAQKILKERGQEITPNKMKRLDEERIVDLSKHEKSQKTFIFLGYFFAIMGGLLGVFMGWHLTSSKKVLPNGEKTYVYSDHDRKQGNRILIIGSIITVVCLMIKFYYTYF